MNDTEDLLRLLKEGKKLFSLKKYSDVVNLFQNVESDNIEYQVLMADSFYALKDYKNAIAFSGRVLSVLGPLKSDFVISQRFNSSLVKCVTGYTERKKIFFESSDLKAREGFNVLNFLSHGKKAPARDAYLSMISSFFVNKPMLIQEWLSAYDILTSIYSDEPVEYTPSELQKFAMVSGAGWSGSGAIYDYLSEFDEIFPIKHENPIFESREGGFRLLIELYLKGDCLRLKKGICKFFLGSILGCYPMATSSCFKLHRRARGSINKIHNAKQAKKILAACSELLKNVEENEKPLKPLQNLANEILLYMVSDTPAGKIPLLDNCIHIRNISLACYLPAGVFLTSLRDPRSNYVALLRENRGYNQAVDEFIDETRIRLENSIKSLEKALLIHERAVLIPMNFEDFVVSEKLRIEIAESLGLDYKARNAFSKFKPWESFINTQLHLTHDKPEEIALIEKELAEYCVEFKTVPLGEN